MQEVLRRWAEYGPRAVISWLCRRKRHMAIFAMRLHRKKVSENWQKRRLSLIFFFILFRNRPGGSVGHSAGKNAEATDVFGLPRLFLAAEVEDGRVLHHPQGTDRADEQNVRTQLEDPLDLV